MVPDNAPLWNVWVRKITEQASHATSGTPQLPTNMVPRPPWHRLDLENSELLYLIIAEGGSFGANSIPLNLNANHVRDAGVDWNLDGSVTSDLYPAGDDLNGDGVADGNGIPEIYDEWHNPIRFYNAPTRLIRPQGEYQDIDRAFLIATAGSLMPEVTAPPPTVPAIHNWWFAYPLNQDPDDPTGALWAARNGEDLNDNNTVDSNSSPPAPLPPYTEDLNNNGMIDPPQGMGYFYNSFLLAFSGGPVTCQPLGEAAFHTLNTYHRPLIVSGGPDGKTGLYEPVVDPAVSPPFDPMIAPLRLGKPLATSVSDTNNLDLLYDNITNRPQ
jgi:hypothetical protein